MLTVIKVGGSTVKKLDNRFFKEIENKVKSGEKVVIVHGGGPEINEKLKCEGITPLMKDGIRYTSKTSLKIVTKVLDEEVNPYVVQLLEKSGLKVRGLSGSRHRLMLCTVLNEEKYGYVGRIRHVQTEWILRCFDNEEIPVISTLGIGENGETLNINADTAAGEIAASLQANSIVFVTDTVGIQLQGATAAEISSSRLHEAITAGEVYGGMIPKAEAALRCLNLNIPVVMVMDQSFKGTRLLKEAISS